MHFNVFAIFKVVLAYQINSQCKQRGIPCSRDPYEYSKSVRLDSHGNLYSSKTAKKILKAFRIPQKHIKNRDEPFPFILEWMEDTPGNEMDRAVFLKRDVLDVFYNKETKRVECFKSPKASVWLKFFSKVLRDVHTSDLNPLARTGSKQS